MTNNTAWVGGRLNSGLGYMAAFNAADLNSLANGSSVLSSVSAFTNAGSSFLDQLMKLSAKLTIASNTIAAGANLAFWIAELNADGTTLGDGRLTAGTQTAYTPAWPALCSIDIQTGTTITTLAGVKSGLLIPPSSFALIMQNNSGFALASSGNSVSIATYDINLND